MKTYLNPTRRGGLTLLEMVLAIAVFTVFSLFVYIGITGTIRVTLMESQLLDMDTSANEILQRISVLTRDAVLPVRMISGNNAAFKERVNDDTNGFGTHAAAWETQLFGGSSFLAFCRSVDGDGSGDRLDGNMLPYLGIARPPTSSSPNVRNGSAMVVGATYNPGFLLSGNANSGLAALQPSTLQDDSVRLAPSLIGTSLPAGAYAVIRFFPLLHNGAPVQVTEIGMQWDFNEDGNLDSEPYHLGNLEIYYPPVTGLDPASGERFSFPGLSIPMGSRSMVLVPASGRTVSDDVLPPLFTLVKVQQDGSLAPGSPNDYDAVRVRLTLINAGDFEYGQNANLGRARYLLSWNPQLIRRYESLINLRSLSY